MMTTPLLQPVISPILVGRDEYLAALDSLASGVKAGQGVTLLVSGEAGIGKSRLVAEARTRFRREPAGRVLQGHCFEHDAGLPYAPFVDLFHNMLAEQPDELSRLLAVAPELAVLLPELADQPVPSTTADAEQDKRRMQQALVRMVATLSGEQPVLLIIEDIHWADGLTLELLQRLAQRVAALRLLLIVTWRDEEESEPLRHFLAAVDRGRTGRELQLARLEPAAVERMLRAMFGQPQPIRPDFLETIVGLTDGNPFFIEEVVTALIASGDIYRENGNWSRKELTELRIPRSVVDAVQQRARGLSGTARQLLDLAAVAGQRFDVGIVQEVLVLDDAALLGAIRELVEARLIVDVSDEQAAFRHALTREAVYAALLARERRAHHLALAEAIERRHAASPGPYAVDLSYHYHAA
ncbi:MAG TPA: AAA family ATPase, partial [Thermomicrobiales bacterium]|nr:AAA family ATPase [Thermomicrobiales bacterium]